MSIPDTSDFGRGVSRTSGGITFTPISPPPAEIVDTSAVAQRILEGQNSSREASPSPPEVSSSGSSSPESHPATPPSPSSFPGFNEMHLNELTISLTNDLLSALKWANVSLNKIQKRSDLTDSVQSKITKMLEDLNSYKQQIHGGTELASLKQLFSQKGWLTDGGHVVASPDDILSSITKELGLTDAPATAPSSLQARAALLTPLSPQEEIDRQETLNVESEARMHAGEVLRQRELFNAKMRLRMTAAYIGAIVFAVLCALTHNPAFFAAAWVCLEYGNAALRVQKETVTQFSRPEVFGWSPVLRVADFILCSLPKKHFTFTPPPAPALETNDQPSVPPTRPETPPEEEQASSQDQRIIEVEIPGFTITPVQSPAESTPESAPAEAPQG